MKRNLHFSIALAVAALVAIPAVAPPKQLSPDQLHAMQESGHSQKLSVSNAADVQKLTPAKYAATAGIQSLANLGTNYAWAKLVLLDGNFPQTTDNVTVILRWMRQENGVNDWWNRNNPLNNGYGAPGAGGTGTNANLITAARNAAGALRANAGGGYAGIVQSLSDCRSATATAHAIWASSWSTSHYANGTHWSTAPVPVVKAPAGAW